MAFLAVGRAQWTVESNVGTLERYVYLILYILFTHAALENIFALALGDQRNSWFSLMCTVVYSSCSR